MPDPLPAPAPTPRKRETKRDKTRAALLETAIKLFAERGIEDTSILAITEAADVSNGAFYYHFANKETLLAEIRLVLTNSVIDELHQEIDRLDSPEEKVALGLQWLVAKATRAPDLGALIAETMSSDDAIRAEMFERLRVDIEAGVARGQFSVTPHPLLFSMLGAVNALCIRACLAGESADWVGLFGAEQHLRLLGVPAHRATMLALTARQKLATQRAT
ncbi:TetR/AcrR family transcriptional regulator [Acidocella sp.]|uniref:TetR/AcrR family transcriptional regulator n=1 Tax=Acidocella sp. TaxID=50710 RepID=UPI003D03F9D5